MGLTKTPPLCDITDIPDVLAQTEHIILRNCVKVCDCRSETLHLNDGSEDSETWRGVKD